MLNSFLKCVQCKCYLTWIVLCQFIYCFKMLRISSVCNLSLYLRHASKKAAVSASEDVLGIIKEPSNSTSSNYFIAVIKEKKECMLKDDSGEKSDEIISGKPRRKAFLELLLQVHLKDSSFTEENIREEVDTFMFEGHDTTAMSISFTLYLLGRYPDVQEKVFRELEEIFGNDREREVTSDDLKNMKYLECVVKESLRLYPSVPMIGRKLTENLKVEKFQTESVI